MNKLRHGPIFNEPVSSYVLWRDKADRWILGYIVLNVVCQLTGKLIRSHVGNVKVFQFRPICIIKFESEVPKNDHEKNSKNFKLIYLKFVYGFLANNDKYAWMTT